MNVPQKTLQIANEIKTMKIRGAGKIARAVAEAIKIAAMEYNGVQSLDEFKKYMINIAKILLSTRPSAVSLPNALTYVLRTLRGTKEFSEARTSVILAAEEFIKNSLEAITRISEIGARRIKESSIILTHCHSTAAVEVIASAYKEGRVLKVYSTETRPFMQGRITVSHLLKYGVPAVQIPDSAVRYIMHEVDYVVVGADTITSNGAVVNKIGTSQVALAAKEARVRVYVAAESYKFSPLTLVGELVKIEFRSPEEIVPKEWLEKHPGIKVLNPVFDVTPPEYVDIVITEYGVIPPPAAILVLIDKLGWKFDSIKYSENILENVEKLVE